MAKKKLIKKPTPSTRKSHGIRSKSKEKLSVKGKPKPTKNRKEKSIQEKKPTAPAIPLKEEIQSEEECAICLNVNDYVRRRTMDCGHRFHSLCIARWLKEATSCPICRKRIKKGHDGQPGLHLFAPEGTEQYRTPFGLLRYRWRI